MIKITMYQCQDMKDQLECNLVIFTFNWFPDALT